MSRPRAPYQTFEHDIVKSKLPDILTMRPDAVLDLVRKHQCEVQPLAEVFNAASEKHHKWQAAVLAQVPVISWVSGPGDEIHIQPSSVASMRFLSRESPGKDALDRNVLKKVMMTRQKLLEDLLGKMSSPCKSAYQPMLRWVAYDKLGDHSVARFPLSSDSAFGYNLLLLENLMGEQLRIYEEKWRKENNWLENESTPSSVTRECSRWALQHLDKLVQRWCKDEVSIGGVPENLLARVSANLSANRALLELAAAEACGMEVACMNENFLRKLNQQGVLEVPDVMNDCAPDECELLLRKLLTCWFGHGGSMLHSDFFKRPMNNSDIEITLLWSQQLQQTYLQERGGLGGPESARRAHGGSRNRFMFVMAVVAAFHCNARISQEFTGHKNSTYAVFPDRTEAKSGNRRTLPTHAAHFLMQAYGQMFFANSGWDLHADRIREYVETSSIKRSHLQQLLHIAVKHRTSRELLALHKHLQQLRCEAER